MVLKARRKATNIGARYVATFGGKTIELLRVPGNPS